MNAAAFLLLLLLALPAHAQTWVSIGAEGSSSVLAAPSLVRYGFGTAWVEKSFPAGPLACTTATFGRDPAVGTIKTCERQTAAAVAMPTCWPRDIGGTGSNLLRWENEKGRVSYFYCPTTPVTYFGWVCRFSYGTTCTYMPSPGYVWSAKVTDLASLWREFVTSDWRSPAWSDIMVDGFKYIESNAPAP